jgi:hypothetical protein
VFLGGSVVAASAVIAGIELAGGSRKSPPVRVFGAAGSFAGLSTATHLSDGTAIETVAVNNWRFGPGQSAFICVLARDGSVLIGTTPFTDNPLQPTAADMELGVLQPDATDFQLIVVPSTTGHEVLPGIGTAGVGGGDVASLVQLPGSGGPSHGQVLFVSTAPYHGWPLHPYGELPSLGCLNLAKGGWSYDAAGSLTASDLAKRSSASDSQKFFPVQSGGPRSSRGMTDIVLLPRSGHAIVAQYFGAETGQSGALLAIDPTTRRVLGGWQIPPVRVFGNPVVCHPRQLSVDPTSADGDERFVVVFDTFDSNGGTVAFPLQEFSYRRGTGTIEPVSTAVRAAQDGTRMELAQFLPDGTLVVARTKSNGLSAATLVAYRKLNGKRALADRPPKYVDAVDTVWGETCPPDVVVAGTDRGGLVRSLSVDAATGNVLIAGLDGTLQTVATRARKGKDAWTVSATLDLGLKLLRTPQRYAIGLRQGTVDDRRRLLWLPCNQLTLGQLPWPVPPVALDQWVYAIPLDESAAKIPLRWPPFP